MRGVSRKFAFLAFVNISHKWCKEGPRLLLITSMKSLTHFRLVLKSAILDDLEGPWNAKEVLDG